MLEPRALFQKLLTESGSAGEAALATQNQVTVYPGGSTFATIQAAIDSIPAQSGPDYFSVYVGPGTYSEKVTLKPWIALMGGEADLVTITHPASQAQFAAVLTAASNTAVSGLTITSVGHSWGDYATALLAVGVENFATAGVVYRSTDEGNAGINLGTAQIDLNASKPSSIRASDCQFLAEAGNAQSGSAAVNVWYQPTQLRIDSFSTISATGGMQNFGLIAATEPVVELEDSKIIGSDFAIYLQQFTGHVTATSCDIEGPVSQGVVVNHGAGAAPPRFQDPRSGDPLKTHRPSK